MDTTHLDIQVQGLALVPNDHPILLQRMEEFDFQTPSSIDPIQFAKDLFGKMIELRGLGLAAPQVGVAVRAFALYSVPGIVCFNPKVVAYSEEKIVLDEGCLSFPNLFISIKRPRSIRVRYAEPNGNIITTPMDGLSCRAFLHELDHLDGVLYQKRANPIHLARAQNQRKRRK